MNYNKDENGDGKSQNEKGYENVKSSRRNGVAGAVMVVFFSWSCNGEVQNRAYVLRIPAGNRGASAPSVSKIERKKVPNVKVRFQLVAAAMKLDSCFFVL